MKPDSVLAKTDKGAREIETRENKLDHRLRALLIMINGKATAAELAKKFEQVGDILPMLDQLAAQGFVAEAGAAGAAAPPSAAAARPPAPQRPVTGPAAGLGDLKRAQMELCMHLRNVLGPDADLITGKIEACRTLDELRAYFAAQRGTLDEWLGKSKSAAFWAKADPYLR
jgi:hypothetical protein